MVGIEDEVASEQAVMAELKAVLRPAKVLAEAVGPVGTYQRMYLLDQLVSMSPPMRVGRGPVSEAPIRVDAALNGAC